MTKKWLLASNYEMQKFLIVLGGVFFLHAGSASAECLLTFNTYGPVYAPAVGDRSLRIVDEIKNHQNCDLIHFQEAWTDSQINIFENGLKSNYQSYSPNHQFRIGIMNLSKKPWTHAETFSYRANYDGDALDDIRKMVGAKKAFNVVEDALPETFSLNTHLHPTSDRVRILQMMDLLNWRVQHSAKPLILTGDFNMDPTSFEHHFLMKILNLDDSMIVVKGQYPAGFCSYCTKNPLGWLSEDHTFDYVFFSHLGASEVGWVPQDIQIALTGDGKPLSDHYGLKVNFHLGNGIPQSLSPDQAKQEMLIILDTAMLKVMNFDPAIDLDYISLMLRVRSEVLSGEGPYGRYFTKIFQK